MKKITFTLIAVLAFSMSAFAQGGTTGPLTWNLNDGTLTISGNGAMPDYIYLSDIPWSEYQPSIHTVVMETGVTRIGISAFYNCTALTSVTIPDGVTTIGYYAFLFCASLPSIAIPDGVTKIESSTFMECINLYSITVPNSLTSIGNSAFYGCTSLTSIIIPNSVKTIGEVAFKACRSLTSIILPDGVTAIGEATFEDCVSLTSIIIPTSVKTIGTYAFANCGRLTSITIPDGITTIGNMTFFNCASLPSITIPDGVTTIGEGAFAYCSSLTSIDVEDENNNYTSEEGVLFNKSKTTLICCPGGKIGTYVISDDVTSIAQEAFYGCKSLTLIIIPNSITTIREWTFADCISLLSITIPSSVTSIKECTFINCYSLTSATIPNSVTSIKEYAFANCMNLTSITNLKFKPVSIKPSVFNKVNQGACTLKVPTSAVSTYQNAAVWKEFNIVGGGIAVNTKANNNNYGYTIGEGLYEAGEEVSVMAIARDGYKFVNWTKDGVEVSNREMYIFTVTEDVELVANFEKDEVGIEETLCATSVQVYPNPTSGQLTIEMSDIRYPISDIAIYDVMGRTVGAYGIRPKIGKSDIGKSEINLSHLPAGIYFIRIQTDKGMVTRKVVKN